MIASTIDRQLFAKCEDARSDSHDPVRQVGALVGTADGDILVTGTNRPPEAVGLSMTQSHLAISMDPLWKYFMLEHAERNAINSARDLGIGLEGTTMYSTLFPCADCARAVVSAGIKRLVVPAAPEPSDADEKWRDHQQYARQIFALAEVEVVEMEGSQNIDFSAEAPGTTGSTR